MAKFISTGMTDVIDRLDRMAGASDNMKREMLESAANVYVDTWKRVIRAKGHVRSGDMANSVDTVFSDGNVGGATAEVYPQGKDRKGVRNAEKAFLLHYGWGKKKGDHFVDQIEREAVEPAVEAMEAVMDRYVKE